MFLAFVSACRATSEAPPGRETAGCSDAEASVEPALVAFLSKARAVHLEVDLAESSGEFERAARLLDDLAHAPAPGGEHPSPEVREVLADTLARLADLESQRSRYDVARAAVERGLTLAVERTHFRGRLYEVLGALEKRNFEELRARGDESGALAAKGRATAALKEAVAIQEDVIQRALGSAKPTR